MQLAADVVERVLDTGGEPYLETKQHQLSWWQLSLLDVHLVLALIVSLVMGLMALLVWMVVPAGFRLLMTSGALFGGHD